MSKSSALPKIRGTLCVAACCVVLAACDSAKTDFVAGCTGSGQSEAACACTYDLAKETLPDNYFTVYAAQISGDDAVAEREMAKLTIPERLGFTARVVEVTAIAAGQCPSG
jgi:hypothetical protein